MRIANRPHEWFLITQYLVLNMDNSKERNSESNPFLGLFNSPNPPTEQNDIPVLAQKDDPLTSLVHRVFGLTLDNGPNRPYGLVLLSDLAGPGQQFDEDTLGAALFERLLLEEPNAHVAKRGPSHFPESHVVQTDIIIYLYECYRRIRLENEISSVVREKVASFILVNSGLALSQPELFNQQDTHLQVMTIFETDAGTDAVLVDFLRHMAENLIKDEGKGALKQAFEPILERVHNHYQQANIIAFSRTHFLLLNAFANHPDLAEILVDYIEPKRAHIPLNYSETLLGTILNISCLPKTSQGQYKYFDLQDLTAVNTVERSMWTGLADLADRVHVLVESLLRDNAQRKRVLSWLGRCLDANVPRGKLWASVSHPLMPVGVGFVSDAFALNLAALLLRLCRPFIDPTKSKDRLFRIDPTYPAASGMEGCSCHVKSFASESCLQPTEDDEIRPIAKRDYSFLTEIFYMTHRAVDLSVRVLLDHAQALYQDMARLQHLTAGANSDAITSALRLHMPKFVTMRCALLEPSLLSLLGQFEVATCVWVLQVLLNPDSDDARDSYAPLCERPLAFPLPQKAPATLRCIPEMVLESVEVWLRLCKQYSSESLEQTELGPVLTMLLVFMSSKHRARNPHLRAHLAQSLKALLPIQDQQSDMDAPLANPLGTFNRTALFNQHPHANQIVECLLNVFVSIEMTGESVAFEQKFNYRRPMYVVMEYLWTIELHRESFRALSRQAEEKMEETDPPLFLRFLNLLINDAIFLLDESLSNMAQLRTMFLEREAGEWERLSAEERRRNEQHFQQTGMIARYDNILGKETIHTLQYMSGDIQSLLCHSTMVDRIAAMLNYFLYHLVSPNKKNFKIKYQDEYKFDPTSIVKDICKIYVSLGESDDFCSAVSRDGRSYSPQLFKYACVVLARIGGGSLIVEVEEVARRVEERHSQLETEEELLADCPEEFLDPIMSTFMCDPVYLPTSRMTVDRATIARHLLSDQTDPFNRAPLTMNMVEPNVELKKKINAWIDERKQRRDQEKVPDIIVTLSD